jgi:hypothetical protein
MQNPASFPADQFSDLLGRLPADIDLDALARQTKAIERNRKLGTGADLLRLALARGPGGLSLSATAAWATMLGFPSLSDPGIKYRLDKAVGFLEAVMTCQLAAKAPGASVRWPGRVLRASDGTCISKRGSKGTDWRVHAVYDLGRGGFSHLELTDGHGAEAIDKGAPVAGEIRIGDRNYATAPSLHRFRQQSARQADFIVRARWNGFCLHRPDGRDFDLIAHLETLPNRRASRSLGWPVSHPSRATVYPPARRGDPRDPDALQEADAGIGDHDVEPAMGAFGAGDYLRPACLVGHVLLQKHRDAAGFGDFAGERRAARGVDIGDHQFRAFPGQKPGAGTTDPRGAIGDDRDLTRHVGHVRFLEIFFSRAASRISPAGASAPARRGGDDQSPRSLRPGWSAGRAPGRGQ